MGKKVKVGVKIPTKNELSKRYPGMVVASESDDSHLPWLPSRFLAFNYQLGGGIPYGKILEIFGEESSGKSMAAYSFASVATDLGGIVLWADAEQSFTMEWAKHHGLDLERVIVLRETSVETISDWVADMAIYWRSILVNNEPILFVTDSMAALDCMENINSKMVDSKADMGNRAKAIYKMFRIRSELLFKLGVCQIYINQLRKNLSAGMFGDPDCLHYDTMVPFTDGTSMKIGDIVRNKVQKNVWSLNEKTMQWEEKPIVGWVEKDPTNKWLSLLYYVDGAELDTREVICTENHLMLTKEGWKKASDLEEEGDYLISGPDALSGINISYRKVALVSEVKTDNLQYKYDLTIDGNHNFLAGSTDTGVLVHNTTPGGKALAFYASQRIGFYGGKQILKKVKGKERKVGRVTSIRVKKNKVSPPRATIKAAPMYNNPMYSQVGFDPYYYLNEVFLELEIIEKTSGGIFKYKGETICRGEDNFIELITKDDELRRKLLRKAGINTIGNTRKLLSKLTTNLFPVDGEVSYTAQSEEVEEEDE